MARFVVSKLIPKEMVAYNTAEKFDKACLKVNGVTKIGNETNNEIGRIFFLWYC